MARARYASISVWHFCCVVCALVALLASKTTNVYLSLATQQYCACVFKVPKTLNYAKRIEGPDATVLLKKLIMGVLRAYLAAKALDLQGEAQQAILGTAEQRVRQALNKGQARNCRTTNRIVVCCKITLVLNLHSVSNAPRISVTLHRPELCVSIFERTVQLRASSNTLTSKLGWYVCSITCLFVRFSARLCLCLLILLAIIYDHSIPRRVWQQKYAHRAAGRTCVLRSIGCRILRPNTRWYFVKHIVSDTVDRYYWSNCANTNFYS